MPTANLGLGNGKLNEINLTFPLIPSHVHHTIVLFLIFAYRIRIYKRTVCFIKMISWSPICSDVLDSSLLHLYIYRPTESLRWFLLGLILFKNYMLRVVLISYTSYVYCWSYILPSPHIFSLFQNSILCHSNIFLMLKEKYLGRVTCDVEIPVCAFLITLWTHNNLTSYVWITYFLTERMNKSILHIMKLNEWAKFMG